MRKTPPIPAVQARGLRHGDRDNANFVVKGKSMCRVRDLFLALLIAMMASTLLAAEMPAQIKAAFDRAGVPIYPGAVFCTGDAQAMGVSALLATSDGVEKVRKWYQTKLSGWKVADGPGSWVLVDGPVDSPTVFLERNNVSVMNDALLPRGCQLGANMTTRVEVMLRRPSPQ